LQQEVTISPTIDVPAGTPLRIFVARDLDFSAAERAP
jgi:type IV secretory pathway VirB10-like protein